MRRLLVPAIATLLSPLVFGQDTLSGETPEIRRYTVEVIIFEYAEDVSVGTEVFLPDVPVVAASAVEPLEEFVFGDTIAEPAATEPPVTTEAESYVDEFVLHIEDEFTLGDIAGRLERLDVYEPVMHFAWTQETHPQEETRAIDLESLGPAPERLSGTFKLYLSRYLHLVVDLTLDDALTVGDPIAIDDSMIAFSDARTGYEFDAPEPGPVRFRIQEDRIFKNGDLRYFDHPKFGVLARITRVEEEEHEVEAEMLGDDPVNLPGGVSQ